MAEIVQRRSENTIKELEHLRQTNLMSEEMINHIIVVRKNMDAKTNNSSKNVDDFKCYIAHEEMILEKVRKCRDKKKISDVKSIEYSIIRRIQRLYENALQYFPSDFTLHEGLFEFSKKHKFTTTASQVIDNMIKLFSYRPEVWKIAAGWYFYNNNQERAFQTLHKGLTINPKSTLLYEAAIDFELKQAKENTNNTEKLFHENRCCEKLKTYVNLILKNMSTELGFLIEILEKLEKFSFTLQVQNLILEHLLENYGNEEIVWHTMAKRERKGIHFVTDPNEAPRLSSFTKSCIKYCRDKYEQGLRKVPTEKKQILWSYCLETFIELNEDEQQTNVAGNLRKEYLKELLSQAHSDRCLSEKHYCLWIELIPSEFEASARQILKEAIEFNPGSEELWKLSLKFAITSDKIKDVEAVFEQGRNALKDKSLELWLIYARYNLLVASNEKMIEIFESAIKEPAVISNVFKPKYLQWVAFHEGINAARTKYRSLAVQPPFCQALHSVMSKLEQSEIIVSYKDWGEVHKLACQQFGKDDIDVWVDYTKFILLNRPKDIKEKLEQTYRDARNNLPVLLWEQYKELYEKLMMENV